MVKCEKHSKSFKLAAVKGELDEPERRETPTIESKAAPEADNEFPNKGKSKQKNLETNHFVAGTIKKSA